MKFFILTALFVMISDFTFALVNSSEEFLHLNCVQHRSESVNCEIQDSVSEDITTKYTLSVAKEVPLPGHPLEICMFATKYMESGYCEFDSSYRELCVEGLLKLSAVSTE